MKRTPGLFGLTLCVALVFGLRTAAAQAGPEEVWVGPEDSPLAPARYAEIELDGPILEALPSIYLLEPNIDTLHGLLERIDKARTDNAVRGVIVKVKSIDAGWAKTEELRQALGRCREDGKTVVCFLESGANLEYFLASGADRVVITPSGTLMLVGLRGEIMFFKGLMDLLGVQGEMVQIGDYKGAAEPFMRTTASEAFRQNINELLDDMYRQLVAAVAEGRKVDPAKVPDLINGGPYTARRAKEAGLVDDLMFYDELLADLQQKEQGPVVLVRKYGEPQSPSMPLGAGPQQIFRNLLGMGMGQMDEGFPRGPVIVVLHAQGPVVDEDPDEVLFGESVVNGERMAQILEKIRKRPNVRAVVVRVDSPGGSAEASDLIWHELRRTDKVKPVIASMSDVAGSGGYYIAAGARTIVADEGTITGSIGVMGGKIVLKGLFDKIGLSVDTFERGENAGLFSSVEMFSDVERQRFEEMLKDTYDIFLDRVAETRQIPKEEIEKFAGGRTLTGKQAVDGKLVDRIGGLEAAIEEARLAAGIAPDEMVSIVHLPKSQSLLEVLIIGRDPGVRMPGPHVGLEQIGLDVRPAVQYLRALRCLEKGGRAVLMPVWITIK